MNDLDLDEIRMEMKLKMREYLISFSTVAGLKELDMSDIKSTYNRCIEDFLDILDNKLNYS